MRTDVIKIRERKNDVKILEGWQYEMEKKFHMFLDEIKCKDNARVESVYAIPVVTKKTVSKDFPNTSTETVEKFMLIILYSYEEDDNSVNDQMSGEVTNS